MKRFVLTYAVYVIFFCFSPFTYFLRNILFYHFFDLAVSFFFIAFSSIKRTLIFNAFSPKRKPNSSQSLLTLYFSTILCKNLIKWLHTRTYTIAVFTMSILNVPDHLQAKIISIVTARRRCKFFNFLNVS